MHLCVDVQLNSKAIVMYVSESPMEKELANTKLSSGIEDILLRGHEVPSVLKFNSSIDLRLL